MSVKKKAIRLKFRQSVFTRDSYHCKVCGLEGIDETLDPHHITPREQMPNGGYVPSNGITLCKRCHIKAEEALIGLTVDSKYQPEHLYDLIKSCPMAAFRDSQQSLS